jgi:hypothetical protein
MEKNDKDKEGKKTKRALISAFIVALLVTFITHLRLGTGRSGFMEMMGPGWGYTVLLVAIFFASFVAMFVLFKSADGIKVELTPEEKQKKKSVRVDIIFLMIDLLASGLFIKINWEQLKTAGTFLAIAEVAAFFAIVWFGFEFFNRFKFFPDRIFKFMMGFFVKVCAPMLVLLVILLGAYQAKYGYDDVFRLQIQENSLKFANIMQDVYFKLITTLYDIGQSNPNLWIWLPVAAFFVMTLLLLYSTFTRPEKKDEEKDAQVLINDVLREQIEEEDYEKGFKKRPMAYSFFKKIGDFLETKKEKEEKLKEKEEYKNMKYNIYSIKFTEMKGGKKE